MEKAFPRWRGGRLLAADSWKTDIPSTGPSCSIPFRLHLACVWPASTWRRCTVEVRLGPVSKIHQWVSISRKELESRTDNLPMIAVHVFADEKEIPNERDASGNTTVNRNRN